MDELLKILAADGRIDHADLASQLDLDVSEVAARIAEYESQGVIRGYQAVLNEDAIETASVKAVIEVKMQPEREGGFDRTALRIGKFPEVRSLYLTSGNFDLLLFVQGKTLQDVASFVAEKLSTIPGVTGTATHFTLKTYKHNGVLMHQEDSHERLKVSP